MEPILQDYQKYYVLSRVHPSVAEYQSMFQQADSAWKQKLNQLVMEQRTQLEKNQSLEQVLQIQQEAIQKSPYIHYEFSNLRDAKSGSEVRLKNEQTLIHQQWRKNWEIVACLSILVGVLVKR